MGTWQKYKLIGAAVLAVLAAVVIFQNRQTDVVHVLFVDISMPRFVLLAVMALLGFAIGVITAMTTKRKR